MTKLTLSGKLYTHEENADKEYSNLYSMITELRNLIEALQASISALEARVAALETP